MEYPLLLKRAEEVAVFFGEFGFFEEVGAVAEGFFEGSFAAPAADLVVIATGEDVGNG